MRVFSENDDSLRHLIGYFSGKSIKLMPPDALISAQNAPKCVGDWPPPRPAGGAYSAPSDPTSWKGKGMGPILYPDLGG